MGWPLQRPDCHSRWPQVRWFCDARIKVGLPHCHLFSSGFLTSQPAQGGTSSQRPEGEPRDRGACRPHTLGTPRPFATLPTRIEGWDPTSHPVPPTSGTSVS